MGMFGHVETQTKSRHVTSKIICCNKYLKIQLSETFSSRRGSHSLRTRQKMHSQPRGRRHSRVWNGYCRSPGAPGVGLLSVPEFLLEEDGLLTG